MTEKIARRGVRVPAEYHADFLDQVLVRDAASTEVVALLSDQSLDEVRAWINSGSGGTTHQGFPILDSKTHLIVGVLTRRNLLDPQNAGSKKLHELIKGFPRVVYDDSTLRDAADHLVNHDIGRLPVVKRGEPGRVVAMLTRSDILGAHRKRLLATGALS
jgi:CBS domain-containing protein